MGASTRPNGSGKRIPRRGLVEPAQPSAEPFRTLRVSLELRPDARRGNIVVFTSAEPGEGKSTMAANYALLASASDRRVLLIDADLRNPVQHEIFDLPRAPGLTETMMATVEPSAAASAVTGAPGLHVLTTGTPVPRAGDIIGSGAFGQILRRASDEYDTVVVDTPPVLAASDAPHVAAHPAADVAFVVDRKQRSRKVKRALAKLELANASVLGFVVNREGRLADYGYHGYR